MCVRHFVEVRPEMYRMASLAQHRDPCKFSGSSTKPRTKCRIHAGGGGAIGDWCLGVFQVSLDRSNQTLIDKGARSLIFT